MRLKPFLNVDDVARRLGLSQPTLYTWIKKKTIKAERVGRRLLIPREEFIRLRDSRASAKAQPRKRQQDLFEQPEPEQAPAPVGLRDYFAAHESSEPPVDWRTDLHRMDAIARWKYLCADAMLKAREARNG